jgi:hypothetical protein
MAIEIRTVGIHEADLIDKLFTDVYGRYMTSDYWRWCFANPFGYINVGLFEYNRLLGYYAAELTRNSACLYSAMVHPKHRKKDIFMKLSHDLLERLSHLRSYVYLFSNEMIREIHTQKEGFIEAYQIIEYRIPITKAPIPPSDHGQLKYDDPYHLWRYRDKPNVKYIFDHRGIFSYFEDRIQIIDFHKDNLEKAIEMAYYLGYWEGKKFISFWCEIDMPYPFVILPTYKHYKIFDKNIDMRDIAHIDMTRMGMSDVF